MSIACTLDKIALYHSGHSSESPLPQCTSENALAKYQLRNILQNLPPVLLKSLKAFKNEESMRKCHTQQEPKNTK